MKLIAIQATNASQGEFIFGAVQDALATERAFFDDAALVLTDAEGVHITHTKGRFGRMFGSGIGDDQAKRILAQGRRRRPRARAWRPRGRRCPRPPRADDHQG
jgi:hypothetical protein